ncbi:MAG TPA: class II fructose-bisphosphate aldolase [Chthonomonadales bacterium]|nr:class II fructose-bisphosphate aldolase [Chthonomonadales bacterium]
MSRTSSPDVKRLVRAAEASGKAVLAFNVPYLPMAEPVCQALAEHGAFGMMEVARLEFTKFEAVSPTAAAREYERHADPRHVSLHLDHIPVIDEDEMRVEWRAYIREALACGYHSVMVDGSRLPFEENLAVAAETVRMAAETGAAVEAELGAVLGHGAGPLPPYETLFAERRGFTEPDEAARYACESGIDWLSVSAGSVHGAIAQATKDQPKVQARLDVERIRALRKAAGVPLVLHGGSGIRMEYIDGAIAAGVAKINIATDIRQPYERALKATGSVSQAQAAVREAMARILRDVFRVEGTADALHEAAEGLA